MRLHNGGQTSSLATHDPLRSMIQKYDSYSTRKPILLEARTVAQERVLVTGTTGGLGSHLLATLLGNENIETVWALNRGPREKVVARQRDAFEDKLLDVGLLESKKLLILGAELEEQSLGLDGPVYQEVSLGL